MKKHLCSRHPYALLACALLVTSAGPTLAKTSNQEDSKWSYTIVPYIWLLGFDGKARIPGLPEIEMKSSFSEILKQFDIGGMVAFEGKRGKFGFAGDLLYSRLSDSGIVPPGLPADGRVTTFTALIAAQMELHRDDRVSVDGLLGFRYWSLDAKASTVAAPGVVFSKDTRWVDPQIGVKASGVMAPRWQWHSSLMIATKSSPSVDFAITLSYATGPNSSLRFGYRHLTVRRLGATSGANASLTGPIVGLAIKF